MMVRKKAWLGAFGCRIIPRAMLSTDNEHIQQSDTSCEPDSQSVGGTPTIRDSLTAAFPIMAGYVVLGLPCGILCAAAGMDWWMTAVMSILFYSGAGQYMIPNMYLAGNPLSAIILSVTLVNTRQMLYGASLSQFCGNVSKRLSFIFGATVTDESFGVNLARFINGGWTVRAALKLSNYMFSQPSDCNVIVSGRLMPTNSPSASRSPL